MELGVPRRLELFRLRSAAVWRTSRGYVLSCALHGRLCIDSIGMSESDGELGGLW